MGTYTRTTRYQCRPITLPRIDRRKYFYKINLTSKLDGDPPQLFGSLGHHLFKY
jgi:hypothetical protein